MSVFGSVVSVILCPILILLGDATVPLAGRITIASIGLFLYLIYYYFEMIFCLNSIS